MGCNESKADKKKNDLRVKAEGSEPKRMLEEKVVLIGDKAVGKSSIAQRYCKNTFSAQHMLTIGAAYLQKEVHIQKGEVVKLHIWDTGGDERFRAMTNLYYRDAAAAILTYDISDERTLESLDYWIGELQTKAVSKNMIMFLAGNKCDIPMDQRKVSYNKGKDFATQNNLIFFETSAKDDIGINELFLEVAKKIYEVKKENANS